LVWSVAVAPILQGKIVFLSEALPDPQGHNPKPNRPYLVITPTPAIKSDGYIEIVAISSSYGYPLADDLVELPFGKGCHTKLSLPSVAVCSWRACIAYAMICSTGGFASQKVLAPILRAIERSGSELIRDDRPPATG